MEFAIRIGKKSPLEPLYEDLTSVLTERPRSSVLSKDHLTLRITKKSDRQRITERIHALRKKGLWSSIEVSFYSDVFSIRLRK